MAYAIGTYEDLQAAIVEEAGGSSDPNFANGVRRAIYRAEQAMNRGVPGGSSLRVPEMMVRSREVVNERWEAMPAGFLELRQAWLIKDFDETLDPESPEANESGIDVPLRKVTPELIAWYSHFFGVPKAINVVGGQYRIEPRTHTTPATTYHVRLWYYKTLPPLSDDNPITTVLDSYPSLYLDGALSYLGAWLVGDPRLAMWRQDFMVGIDAANMAAGRVARMRSSQAA